MQIRTILVPTDFSDSSAAALAMASSLARDNNARLLIVHVQEPAVMYSGLGAAYATLPEEQRTDPQQLLDAVYPSNPAVQFERRLINGSPASEIVEMAKTEDGIDIVVLGTHGRTGLRRLLMGSVAEAVVRNSPCPVLTVKEPAAATTSRPSAHREGHERHAERTLREKS